MPHLINRHPNVLERETQKSIRRFQTLLFLGALLYPAWWYAFKKFSPSTKLIPGEYLAVSGIFLASFLFSLGKQALPWVVRIFYVPSLTMTLHQFLVVWRNDLGLINIAATFIVVAVISSVFISPRAILYYSATVLGAACLISIGHPAPLAGFLIFGLLTMLLISYTSVFYRMSFLESLHSSETRVRDLNQRLTSILESMADGFASLDRQYRVLYANSEALRLAGLSGREVVGRSLWELFPEAEGTDFRRLYAAAMAGAPERARQFHASLGIWLEARAYSTESGISLFFTDVTRRVEMEKLVEDQRLKAIAASRMSTLGEMAAGIAHEINNPLAIIHGRAAQIRESALEGEVPRDMALKASERIEETAIRISRIVKALRSFARDGEGDPFQESTPGRILEDVMDLCRERFRNAGIDLRLPRGPALHAPISCRASQLCQALVHLMANAYDSVLELDERWVAIELVDLGTELEASVTDSGSGIDPAIREKIFQPFFTTKEVGSGAGLGLSVSKGIVESHGGSISLDASSSRTRFLVRLPKRALSAAK